MKKRNGLKANKPNAAQGFVTTSEAAKILRARGIGINEDRLGKMVDSGLFGGARLLHHPRRSRVIDKETLEKMVENAKTGKKLDSGLKLEKTSFQPPARYAIISSMSDLMSSASSSPKPFM